MEVQPFTPTHFSTLAAWFPSQAALVQWGGHKLICPLDPPQMQAMLAEGAGDPPLRRCWMAVTSRCR